MTEKIYKTSKGDIHYYVNSFEPERDTIVFLPGLTADHRLFEKQTEYFLDKANVLVWDAPGHAASRPFQLDFSLRDKAVWLEEILQQEKIIEPFLVGQSMGGYVIQSYLEHRLGKVKGVMIIDSAPLALEFSNKLDLWFMDHAEKMYLWYPWKRLVIDGAKGTAETEHGRRLMYSMMEQYGHKEYASLAGHGYRMVSEAIKANLKYELPDNALLICGKKDHAGYTKKYNKEWTAKRGCSLVWLDDAGHNSNTDKPDETNAIIEKYIRTQ